MSGPLRFWKMSGAGNDFLVLPGPPENLGRPIESFVRRVCRRGLSVGADGVLFVWRADSGSRGGSADEGCVILAHFNADGSRSEFCGNGTRCAARFAVHSGLARSPLSVRTDAAELRADVEGDEVRIEVPLPSVPERRVCERDGQSHEGWYVVAGVPHFVIRVEEASQVDVQRLGAALRSHPALGQGGANIDFLGPAARGRARLRTFERGVEAETLACGSGALAAAAVLAHEGGKSPIVLVPTSGIELTVGFEEDRDGRRTFWLAGSARVLFEGALDERVLAEGGGS